MINHLQEERIRRLGWQCRRGMLELDLVLQSFLDQHYLNLNSHDKDLFEQLLTYSDQDLYGYLIKRQPVPHEAMQALTERVSCGR